LPSTSWQTCCSCQSSPGCGASPHGRNRTLLCGFGPTIPYSHGRLIWPSQPLKPPRKCVCWDKSLPNPSSDALCLNAARCGIGFASLSAGAHLQDGSPKVKHLPIQAKLQTGRPEGMPLFTTPWPPPAFFCAQTTTFFRTLLAIKRLQIPSAVALVVGL
jgi:hypothetical protein